MSSQPQIPTTNNTFADQSLFSIYTKVKEQLNLNAARMESLKWSTFPFIYKVGLNHFITTFNLPNSPASPLSFLVISLSPSFHSTLSTEYCQSFALNQSMTRNSSAGDILAPGDAAQLIELDLVNLPNPPNGVIQIHKRRLNRTSDAVHKNIPLNANVESRPDAFATIPEKLISKATIEYVGFNSEKATEIWSGWDNWPSGPIIREIALGDSTNPEVSFIDWVKSKTGNPLEYDVWEDDNSAWFRHMEQCGIATELQHSIMDPRFKDMWFTGTCIGWLRNTMELRYEWLEEIQRASAEREKALGHQGTSTRSKRQR
ncbi:hypothetical protein FNYG_01132 [Fusarium nygamai]|uniref:Uncharacterized protein n=1 Tax=Gibberella nygamai TaxID=42673 RepID=A0A2K0WV03_GIBNY|nr:hypothetical protein FNYG_01132 [Fusarium nygamai]